jgi:RimJ/RimL family protein N-acetyltransferase
MKTIISKTGKKIIFRAPQANDLRVLFQYAQEIEAEDTYINLNPKEPVTLAEEKEVLESWLKKQKELKKINTMVFDHQKLIGNCSLEKRGRRSNHVGNLGVALLKSYRSQGIGRQLVEHTINQAKKTLKISQVFLSCLANNKVALKFYHSLGFKKIGIHPKTHLYKGNYIDSILFYKELK